MHKFSLVLPACVWAGLLCAAAASAQTAPRGDSASWIARWQARATRTQAQQPKWATPVATSSPRLDQSMRMEFVRQTNTKRDNTWNLGNNKGLELIPERHTELIFGVPPFFDHGQPGVKDGFGDVWFQGKYRFFTRNEKQGNAMATAIVYATLPTGKDANGSCCAVVTPTIAAGKGYGRFDVVSTLGGALPVTNAQELGRTIAWNTAAQYRAGTGAVTRLLVPEIEMNSTFYHGGVNDGKVATFATVGMVVGRIALSHDTNGKAGRRAVTFAAGEQIALTHFHTYNHGLILSMRLPF
ncbi:MAG TPA: hypothetical protein VGU46_10275 [Acidobacteriaceae bacterium]|nr:hypothetical protein [Acidobacteriaceae bacterium]